MSKPGFNPRKLMELAIESTTAPEYTDTLGFDKRKTQRQLRKFIELGLIRRIGQGKASRYEVIR